MFMLDGTQAPMAVCAWPMPTRVERRGWHQGRHPLVRLPQVMRPVSFASQPNFGQNL